MAKHVHASCLLSEHSFRAVDVWHCNGGDKIDKN